MQVPAHMKEHDKRKVIRDFIEGRITRHELLSSGIEYSELEQLLEKELKVWVRKKRATSSLKDAALAGLTFIPSYWISVPLAMLAIKIIDGERSFLIKSSQVAAKALDIYHEMFLDAPSEEVLEMLICKWRHINAKAKSRTFLNIQKLVSGIVKKLDSSKKDVILIPSTYRQALIRAAIAHNIGQKFRIPSTTVDESLMDECLESLCISLKELKTSFPPDIAKELRRNVS